MPIAKIFAQVSKLGELGRQFAPLNHSAIGEIILSCSHKEDITFSNTIVKKRVQSGATLTDHVTANQDRITIHGSVNDTVSDFVSFGRNLAENLQGNVAQNLLDLYNGKGKNQIKAYEVLKSLSHSGTFIEIVMYQDTFQNVLVERVYIPRDEKTGRRLYFEADLVVVQIAEVKTVNIFHNPQNVIDSVSSTTKRGLVQTKDASLAQEEAIIDTSKKVQSSTLDKILQTSIDYYDVAASKVKNSFKKERGL